jgi:hypothetical protein
LVFNPRQATLDGSRTPKGIN